MIDLDLIAQCWLCSWPFRKGRTTSSDPLTQAALDALCRGGYQALTAVVGFDVVGKVMRRVEILDPPLAPTTAVRRPLLVDEQVEWTALNDPFLSDYYSESELPAAHWRARE